MSIIGFPSIVHVTPWNRILLYPSPALLKSPHAAAGELGATLIRIAAWNNVEYPEPAFG
jgi:hypothetical protein